MAPQVVALATALADEDALAVDAALDAQFRHAGFGADCVPALNALLPASWHQRHEDLASVLQELRDPRSVDCLYNAATMRFAYLDQSDCIDSFHRKCTWALADIGNYQAHAALVHLSTSDDGVLAAFAQRRLERWDDEGHRKRGD